MKVSVLDLGFNSAKLVNYHVNYDGSYRAYQQESMKVKLGLDLAKTGAIANGSLNRTIDALRLFRDIVGFQSIKHVIPVATSAVREAVNKTEFVEQVFHETGFRFRILSGKEEALYSYLGALHATCLPTGLFFDLGGGSLELVYSENFRIKNSLSLPLGGLRLSQTFSDSDGTFSRKNYSKMEENVSEVLPDRKELDMSFNVALVGVGGTLRAIARYDQEILSYPLDKIHGYQMDFERVNLISGIFRKMKLSEITMIDNVGNSRADTITAGSLVIKQLMERLEFDGVTVSTHGLREGVLSAYLQSLKKYNTSSLQQLDQKNENQAECCKPRIIPECTRSFINPLLSSGLLKKKENEILTHALKQVKNLPRLTNLNNLFCAIMDEDKAGLNHREQLVLALSIIHAKKSKIASWLFTKYHSIVQPQDKKSIQKIAAILSLAEILEQAKIRTKFIYYSQTELLLILIPSRNILPTRLIENHLKKLQDAFELTMSHTISSTPRSSVPKLRVSVTSCEKDMITSRYYSSNV